MQTAIIPSDQLFKKREDVKQKIEQFRQENCRLERGSSEQIAVEVAICTLRIELCTLQEEILIRCAARIQSNFNASV